MFYIEPFFLRVYLQILMEFHRATDLNMDQLFDEGLKKYSQAILSVTCSTKLRQTIEQQINEAESEDSKKRKYWMVTVSR